MLMILPCDLSEHVRGYIYALVERCKWLRVGWKTSYGICSCSHGRRCRTVVPRPATRKSHTSPTWLRYVYPSGSFDRRTEKEQKNSHRRERRGTGHPSVTWEVREPRCIFSKPKARTQSAKPGNRHRMRRGMGDARAHLLRHAWQRDREPTSLANESEGRCRSNEERVSHRSNNYCSH